MKLLKTELYRFQREASKLALLKAGFGLWMEQGTGKTIAALKVIAVRWRRSGVRLVLIVGPKNVIGGWQRQITRHLNVPATVYTRDDVLDPRVIRASCGDDRLVFVIINYEMAWRRIKILQRMKFDMMVADEGHRLRRRTSKQSKAMWRLGRTIPYRLALTGTPQGKTELDLWAQMRFIDENVLGYTWKTFEKRYLRKQVINTRLGERVFDKIKFKPKKRDMMLDRISPYVFRIEARQALDLPPVTDDEILFSLTGQAKKAYRELEREFLFKFGDLQSTTPLAITNMLRLHQLTGGHLGMDDKSVLRLEQDKLLTFADWLEDFPLDEKLVVFCQFTQEIDLIAELMRRRGRSYVIRDGRTKNAELNDWMKFQDQKDPMTYIAQIASGGIGTDLFAARVGVFYSNSLNFIDYDQARKRLDRNGQTRPVFFIHMVARNTIDEDIVDGLQTKGLNAEGTLRHIQQRGTNIMAKKATTKAKTETAAPETEEKAKKGSNLPRKGAEFGPSKLAESLEMKAADVRVLLRKGDYAERFKKEDVWDFGNQKTIDSLVKEIRKAKAEADKAKAAKAKE